MEKKTLEYLKENMAKLRGKAITPPKSPYLNSREYSIWAYMEQKPYKKPHPSVDALRTTITRTWKKMKEVYVKKTWQSFCHGLESIITKNGGIIE